MFQKNKKKHRAAHTNIQIECIILVERQLKQISYYRIPFYFVSDLGHRGALPK